MLKDEQYGLSGNHFEKKILMISVQKINKIRENISKIYCNFYALFKDLL